MSLLTSNAEKAGATRAESLSKASDSDRRLSSGDPFSLASRGEARLRSSLPVKVGAAIGTGQAGPSLAVRLAASGRNTAVLERKRFGGT